MVDPSSSGSPLIRDISDTARWAAWCRAVESDRPDGLFRDPLAKRLAGERGPAIEEAMIKGRGSTVSSLVVRTVSFDRMIMARLSEGGVDTIVNLAAGLDTRPYRLALPRHLRWVEVDLPELISYKDACLAEERAACQVERVALDLSLADARREWLASIGGRAGSAFVVTEGLLLYLEPALVTDLAKDLASVAAFGTWMTDLLHPSLLPFVVQSWNIQETGAVNVPRFAPDGGAEFFRPLGWTLSDRISAWEEGERLHRPVGPSSTTLAEAQKEALRVMNTYVRLDRTTKNPRSALWADGAPSPL